MRDRAEVLSLMVGIDGAAELLGVSPDTIRRLIHDGDLPAMRCGRGKLKGHIRIRRDALFEFIKLREQLGVK